MLTKTKNNFNGAPEATLDSFRILENATCQNMLNEKIRNAKLRGTTILFLTFITLTFVTTTNWFQRQS